MPNDGWRVMKNWNNSNRWDLMRCRKPLSLGASHWKRWISSYPSVRIFTHFVCRDAANLWGLLFLCSLLTTPPSPKEAWPLPCASRIYSKSEALVVGHEPACPISNVETREEELVIRRSCWVVGRSWVWLEPYCWKVQQRKMWRVGLVDGISFFHSMSVSSCIELSLLVL